MKGKRRVNSHGQCGAHTETLESIPVAKRETCALNDQMSRSPVSSPPCCLAFFHSSKALSSFPTPDLLHPASCIFFSISCNHRFLTLSSNLTSWPTCASISVPFKMFWSADMILNFDYRRKQGDNRGGKRSLLGFSVLFLAVS